MPNKRPNSRRNLDAALERLVGSADLVAKRAVVANAIVARLLPGGAVKGGSAIKMRLGDGATGRRASRPTWTSRGRPPSAISPNGSRSRSRPDGRASRACWPRGGKRTPPGSRRNT